MTIAKWLHMGGFAIYVWPSYGLIIVGVILNIFWAKRSARAARVAARRRLAMRTEQSGNEP